MPLISVVIPTYNRSSTISRTVNSVLNQSYQDFEIIIVDDGSSDDTENVISRINDNRVRYIRQANSGACSARNNGIKNAAGEIIALLDSDDEWLPHHLKDAYTCIANRHDRVCYSRIIVSRGAGLTFTKPPRPLKKGEHISEYLLCDKGFLQTSTLVLYKELALKTLFTESLPFGQDTDFAIRLGANNAEFVIQENPSVIWSDEFDESRISSSPRPEPREKWLREIKGLLTDRAYIADRGWHLAKCYRAHGKPIKAVWLYLNAAIRGAYNKKHAIIVGLQVMLPKATYRKLADVAIKNGI